MTTYPMVAGGCGTFYAIRISSPAFIGLARVKQHRLVNDVLKEEIKGIHGLTVRLLSLSLPLLLTPSYELGLIHAFFCSLKTAVDKCTRL